MKTKKATSHTSFVRRSEPAPTRVYDTYWGFACRRQEVYFNRFERAHGPWTSDPILASNRFTNVYRAADRVSQYLIKDVIYARSCGGQDLVLRVLLFKLFNRIETWQLLEREFGEIGRESFDVDAFDRILTRAMAAGQRIYSAAYIMPTAPRSAHARSKHRTHLELLQFLLDNRIAAKMLACVSMRELYETLLSVPSVGPFLAYQYSVDLTYSEQFDFTEDDFVQPGPGALHGIAKCFRTLGDYSPAEAIEWVKDRQEKELEARGLHFQTLWGRRLHLIDCQNLFCEVDKYARVAHPEFNALTQRSRIKQRFFPSGDISAPWFPPKWKLDVTDVRRPAPSLSAGQLDLAFK